MLGISDDAIIIIPHPYFARCSTDFVQCLCRKTFPAVENSRKLVTFREFKQHMNVVGHDDIGMQPISLTVEMLNRRGDYVSAAFIGEDAIAVSTIQPLFHAIWKKTQVFLFGFIRQRFGVSCSPFAQFFPPLRENGFRNRIRKAECHKHNGTIEAPVREVVLAGSNRNKACGEVGRGSRNGIGELDGSWGWRRRDGGFPS